MPRGSSRSAGLLARIFEVSDPLSSGNSTFVEHEHHRFGTERKLPRDTFVRKQQQDSPWTCTICDPPRQLAHKKTLTKHIRSVHEKSRFKCAYCELQFSRKDVKDRHEAEKHSGRAKYVQCDACEKYILFRLVDDHLRSQRHCNAESEADKAFCRDLRLTLALCPAYERQIEHLIDPFLLTAQLFYEAHDFKSSPDICDQVCPPATISNDVGLLMCLALRVLRRKWLDHLDVERPPLMWSIAILATVSALLSGLEATKPHGEALDYLTAQPQPYDLAGWLDPQRWRAPIPRGFGTVITATSNQTQARKESAWTSTTRLLSQRNARDKFPSARIAFQCISQAERFITRPGFCDTTSWLSMKEAWAIRSRTQIQESANVCQTPK